MDIKDPYVALCFDQAVGYMGATIQSELEEAGQKPNKADQKAKMARDRILKKYFGDRYGDDKQQFADPSALFN